MVTDRAGAEPGAVQAVRDPQDGDGQGERGGAERAYAVARHQRRHAAEH